MELLFKDKSYSDINSIANDLYLDDDFFELIHSKSFIDFINNESEAKGEKLLKLLSISFPRDVFIFKVGEILNPFMDFHFHHYNFSNYKILGETILASSPNPNQALLNILKYNLISEHMRNSNYSNSNKDLYQKVIEIEAKSTIDLTYSYYSMGYLLSQSTGIVFDGILYKDIYNLTYFLLKKNEDLNTLGAYFSFSPLLKAYSDYSIDGQKIKDYLHLCSQLDKSESNLNDFLNKKQSK